MQELITHINIKDGELTQEDKEKLINLLNLKDEEFKEFKGPSAQQDIEFFLLFTNIMIRKLQLNYELKSLEREMIAAILDESVTAIVEYRTLDEVNTHDNLDSYVIQLEEEGYQFVDCIGYVNLYYQ